MITKRGKRWVVRAQYKGVRRPVPGSFETERDAKVAYRTAQAELEADVDREVDAVPTVDEFAAFWLEGHRERVKPSTYRTSEQNLRRFRQDFGARTLDSITALEAERWARQHRYCVQRVSSVMNDAVRKRLAPSNPFYGQGSKGRGRKDIVPLTRLELARLADCAERSLRDYGPMFKALVLFAGWTGFRASELFALEWRDLDLENGRVHLRRQCYDGRITTLKSGEPERFLPVEAKAAIANLERDGDLVFRSKEGERLCRTAVSRAWDKVEVLFGERVTLHVLRHSAGWHMYVTLGLPDSVVAVQLGHDGPDMVRRLYGHGNVGALDRLEAAFGRTVVPLEPLRVADEVADRRDRAV